MSSVTNGAKRSRLLIAAAVALAAAITGVAVKRMRDSATATREAERQAYLARTAAQNAAVEARNEASMTKEQRAYREQRLRDDAMLPLPVTFGELFGAYNENPKASDDRFKGKVLSVQGFANAIYEVSRDGASVQFRRPDSRITILATFDHNGLDAKTMADDLVRFKCRCDGWSGGILILNDCEVDRRFLPSL
jgi:hypothetical protein